MATIACSGHAMGWMLTGFLLMGSLLAAAQTPNGEGSDVPRHPLETRALVEPDAVLGEIPAALAQARLRGDSRTESLLQLARANACRVIADWNCQRDAGAEAKKIASSINEPIIGVRGRIAESRALIVQKDYMRGTHLLAEAELLLRKHPSPVLAADIMLGYSSMNFSLGRHARSAQYAERGLAELGEGRGLPMQVRLLRNLARAQTQLGDLPAARKALERAQELATQFVDPKLAAELALEAARTAHGEQDVATQRKNGLQILALAESLRNSQLAGLGREVLGDAASDGGDVSLARRELTRAVDSFRDLGLERDELRVLYKLVGAQVAEAGPSHPWSPVLTRLLALQSSVEGGSRAQVADDLDAGVKYAEQELDLAHMEREASLARVRETALAHSNRLTLWLVLGAVALLVVLAAFYWQVRRSHARLSATLEALREREAQASGLLNMSKGGVLLHGIDGVVIMANPAALEALGRERESIVGRSLLEALPKIGPARLGEYLEKVVSEGSCEGVMEVPSSDGAVRHWRFTSSYSTPLGARPYVICHAVDVTADTLKVEELLAQNLRDELTGAYNRRELERFEARHKDNAPWAVIVLDLDGFKLVNDAHGHEHGDDVLVAFSRFLHDMVRASDAVVRLGGDEFAILMGQAEQASLERLLDRVRVGASSAPCEFSMGSALRQPREPLSATLSRADAAMYVAKSAREPHSTRA